MLTPMLRWLKALLVLAALVSGVPTAAWAHGGHDHGAQPPSHRVSVATAVGPAGQTIDAARAVALERPGVQRFWMWFTPVAPTEQVADPSQSAKDDHVPDLRADRNATLGDKPAQSPLHQSSCCCGSVACHSGVDIPTLDVADQYRFGDKVELPPVLAMAGAIAGGIERPPRSSVPL